MVHQNRLRLRKIMPPKDPKNYKPPSRVGRVGVLLWLDRDLRTELKVAAIRNQTTIQGVLEAAARDYVAKQEQRPSVRPRTHKPGTRGDG